MRRGKKGIGHSKGGRTSGARLELHEVANILEPDEVLHSYESCYAPHVTVVEKTHLVRLQKACTARLSSGRHHKY